MGILGSMFGFGAEQPRRGRPEADAESVALWAELKQLEKNSGGCCSVMKRFGENISVKFSGSQVAYILSNNYCPHCGKRL